MVTRTGSITRGVAVFSTVTRPFRSIRIPEPGETVSVHLFVTSVCLPFVSLVNTRKVALPPGRIVRLAGSMTKTGVGDGADTGAGVGVAVTTGVGVATGAEVGLPPGGFGTDVVPGEGVAVGLAVGVTAMVVAVGFVVVVAADVPVG
jgi:hypothetical protein